MQCIINNTLLEGLQICCCFGHIWAIFLYFSQTSPFKRNLSLRLNELPSNLSRQQNEFERPIAAGSHVPIIEGEEGERDSLQPSAITVPRWRPTLSLLSVVETSPPPSANLASALTDQAPSQGNGFDPIAEMCQQLTKGLTGLASDENKNTAAAAARPEDGRTGTLILALSLLLCGECLIM